MPKHEIRNLEPLCVSVPEAARMLGITRSTAYELVKTGAIPSIRIGPRRVIVPLQALREKFSGVARTPEQPKPEFEPVVIRLEPKAI